MKNQEIQQSQEKASILLKLNFYQNLTEDEVERISFIYGKEFCNTSVLKYNHPVPQQDLFAWEVVK